MKKVFRNNGLSLVLFFLFAAFIVGQSWAGHLRRLEEETQHGRPPGRYLDYVASSDFFESVFENWESEFLQMALFVILTAVLYQKGSAESNDPATERKPMKPRAGGARRFLYEHSLSLALFLLFAVSFVGHAISGCRAYNEHEAEHGGRTVGVVAYLATPQFWFESFQNWQSEFLSIGAMVVLTIWLREKDSTQSKKVDAPHSQTGP